jgi:hypothetical protein
LEGGVVGAHAGTLTHSVFVVRSFSSASRGASNVMP